MNDSLTTAKAIGGIFERYWKVFIGVFLVFVFIGSVVILVNNQQSSREQKAQTSYFLTEKKYLEIKNKASAPVAANTPSPVIDYSEVKRDFEKVITEFPGTKAAQMAGVYLSDIYSGENNKSLALTILKKVEGTDSGLVNTLVQQQIALLLADQDKCSESLTLLQKILERKKAQFLHNSVRLQQALCYKKLNDLKKAEEILTNLANQKQDGGLETSSSAKEAEKYLRLFQFKKASGT